MFTFADDVTDTLLIFVDDVTDTLFIFAPELRVPVVLGTFVTDAVAVKPPADVDVAAAALTVLDVPPYDPTVVAAVVEPLPVPLL